MSFRELLNRIVDKLTTGPRAQWILGGTLVVIIVLSLASLVPVLSPRRAEGPSEIRGYCLETKQEFTVNLNVPPPISEDDPEAASGGIPPGVSMDGLIYSPFTKKRTAVPMTQCPACKRWFVPNHLKDALERRRNGQPPLLGPSGRNEPLVCPHCNTDLIQWYRDHRTKR